MSTDRHKKASPNTLSELLGICPRKAAQTLCVTRQKGSRSVILSIGRRHRADRMYDIKRLNGKFATDTLYSIIVSLWGNKSSQIYSHKCGLKAAYHMIRVNKEHIGQILKDFIFKYGAPKSLTYDGAAVQVVFKT